MLEDNGAVLVNRDLPPFLSNGLSNYVDFAAEQAGDTLLELLQRPEVLSSALKQFVIQAHRNVNIGARPRFVSGQGSEHGSAQYPDALWLRFMVAWR